MRSQPISPRAFAMLLLACMFAGNHVAARVARVALDHGVDVATAVAVRSLGTAAVVAVIVRRYRVPLALQARPRKMMPLIALVAGASFGLVLALLTLLYGTAFTVMFTLLPKLGVVGSSPILNVEPVAALAMAWLWLGQSISMIQVLGALLVVGTVMVLGLRRR